jgi:hypothetical protein
MEPNGEAAGPADLIISGAEDHIVDARLWDSAPGFTWPTTVRRTIDAAGHFPWIGNPDAVREAFAVFTTWIEQTVPGS